MARLNAALHNAQTHIKSALQRVIFGHHLLRVLEAEKIG
jgi:hypothetical protein